MYLLHIFSTDAWSKWKWFELVSLVFDSIVITLYVNLYTSQRRSHFLLDFSSECYI
jgi:hypothetical protein